MAPFGIFAEIVLAIVCDVGRIFQFAASVLVDDRRNCLAVGESFPFAVLADVVAVVFDDMSVAAGILVQDGRNLLVGRKPFPSPLPAVAENAPVIDAVGIGDFVFIFLAAGDTVVVKVADTVPVIVGVAAEVA